MQNRVLRSQLALRACVLCRGFYRLEGNVVIIVGSSDIPEDGLEYVPVPSLAFANEDHRSAQDKADHRAAFIARLASRNTLVSVTTRVNSKASERIRVPTAIRDKIRPEPVREPMPPAPKQYAPPRATTARQLSGAADGCQMSVSAPAPYKAIPGVAECTGQVR